MEVEPFGEKSMPKYLHLSVRFNAGMITCPIIKASSSIRHFFSFLQLLIAIEIHFTGFMSNSYYESKPDVV